MDPGLDYANGQVRIPRGSYREKFNTLRERFAVSTTAREHYEKELKQCQDKIKDLEDENNLLLDVLSMSVNRDPALQQLLALDPNMTLSHSPVHTHPPQQQQSSSNWKLPPPPNTRGAFAPYSSPPPLPAAAAAAAAATTAAATPYYDSGHPHAHVHGHSHSHSRQDQPPPRQPHPHAHAHGEYSSSHGDSRRQTQQSNPHSQHPHPLPLPHQHQYRIKEERIGDRDLPPAPTPGYTNGHNDPNGNVTRPGSKHSMNDIMNMD